MQLRDNWNFHGDVTTVLEGIICDHFKLPINITAHDVPFFSSAYIEQGTLAEVIVFLLMDKFKEYLFIGHESFKKMEDFIDRCQDDYGKSYTKMTNENANELIKTFEQLYYSNQKK